MVEKRNKPKYPSPHPTPRAMHADMINHLSWFHAPFKHVFITCGAGKISSRMWTEYVRTAGPFFVAPTCSHGHEHPSIFFMKPWISPQFPGVQMEQNLSKMQVKVKVNKLVTLLWYKMIHGLQTIKFRVSVVIPERKLQYTSQNYALARYTSSELGNSNKKKRDENRIMTFLQGRRTFCFREWKCSETKKAEGYCWAITQASERPCCGRSGFCVVAFGSQLDYTAYTVHTK
jgi:hypothetical protein